MAGAAAYRCMGPAAGDHSWIMTVYLTYIYGKISQAMPMAIQIIVAWIEVERAFACNFPVSFSKINKRSVAISIIVGSSLLSFGLFAPYTFSNTYKYNYEKGIYERSVRWLKNDPIYAKYESAVGPASFAEVCVSSVAAAATVFGLLAISKRKKRIIASGSAKSLSAKAMLRQIETNKQLCFLQIFEALPIVISSAITRYIRLTSFEGSYSKLVKMPLADAEWHVQRCNEWFYLAATVVIIQSVLAHSTRFFRHFVFSKRFRDVVINAVKKNQVSSSSAS